MNRRRTRRVAAFLAVAGGAAVTAAAATEHRRRPGFLGVDWIANVVIDGRYGLLLCGVTLVVLARGLLHGKRMAHRLGLVAALVGAVSLQGHHPASLVALTLLATLAMVSLVGHRAFSASSDPARARRGWWILAAGECTVFVYGVFGLYLLDRDFRRSTTVVESVLSGARLLFLLPSTSAPVTRHGAFFIESVRVASFSVAIVGLAGIVATVVARSASEASDRATVQDLLATWATNGLAPFLLGDDKNWWFATDRSAVLAYSVVRRTAVVLGEPVGSPAGCIDAVEGFLVLCDRNGWVVGFHQVTDTGRILLGEFGLRALKIGEDAVIPVDQFDLSSATHKSLRSALRRIQRSGYHVRELPQPIDDSTMEALREVSDSWLSAGGHRERRFTIGQFDPDYLRATTVLALVGDDDHIVAFVNTLPSYRSENGNFDLMRRSTDAPNGAIEALFVAMIERCKALGLTGLELGFAPLANIDQGSIAGRAMSAAYEHARSAFNFAGLRSFKEKWDPLWAPRFLCYQHGADLPRLGAAVILAGEISSTTSRLRRLRDVLVRHPVAISIAGLQVYVMAATGLSSELHRQFIRHFAFGWHDLVHLQLWRLVTSPFIQDRPGFAWGNLLVLVPALLVAERRLGSVLTAAVFALGDIASTLTVLVIARLVGALGNASAMAAAIHRDGGSSSAGFALVGGLAASLPAGRTRSTAIVALVTFLVGAVIIDHSEADVQHLAAALFGVAIFAVSRWRVARP